jgi:hypothetical protein
MLELHCDQKSYMLLTHKCRTENNAQSSLALLITPNLGLSDPDIVPIKCHP